MTRNPEPHTQMHSCPGLGGLTIPFVEVGSLADRPDARHVMVEREDFAGPDGQRYMGVRTVHGSGREDFTVFAEAAVVDSQAINIAEPPEPGEERG